MNTSLTEPKPLFAALEQMVSWMVNVAPHEGTVKGPAFARWQKTSDREMTDEAPKTPRYGPELAGKPKGMDAAGQMGMLGSFFNRLPPDQYYHVVAKYLVTPAKSAESATAETHAQRQSQRLWVNEQRRNAREFLAMLMQGQFGKDVDLRVFITLVEKFYGEKVSIARLAKQAGMSRYQVRKLDVDVFVSLDALSVRTERVVYSRLSEGGIVV